MTLRTAFWCIVLSLGLCGCLFPGKESCLLECNCYCACDDSADDHLEYCVDPDESHNEREDVLSAAEPLDILGVAEEEYQSGHKEKRVEEGGEES